jgi:hypothetical protein
VAANFKISVRRENRSLHLNLTGHFDGSSAHELIHLLRKLCKGTSKVYIHTDGLRQIHPFGRSTFRNNLPLLARQGIDIVLAGENAGQMLPEYDGDSRGVSLAVD